MFSKPIPARLLANQALDLHARLFVQDNIIEPMRVVAQFHQVRKVPARNRERHSYRLTPTAAPTRLINRLPNPFGDASMALPRLGGGYLQGDREELLIVAGGSAAQHRKDLSGVGHGVDTSLYLWIALVIHDTDRRSKRQRGKSVAAGRSRDVIGASNIPVAAGCASPNTGSTPRAASAHGRTLARHRAVRGPARVDGKVLIGELRRVLATVTERACSLTFFGRLRFFS